MSALEFILLMLFIIGLLTSAYYASICLPVVLEKSQPRRYADPERNYLIPPEHIDVNENKPEPVVTAPVGFVDGDGQHQLNPDDSYPSAPNKSRSLNGEDYRASSDNTCNPASYDDEVPQNIRQLERLQQCRSESDRSAPERTSLLQGDNEDGLIVCEPSVRSKNTGEPIPPTCAKPAHTFIPIVAVGMRSPPQPETHTEEGEAQPMNLSCKPSANSTEHVPSHTVVSAPEPQNVPPAMSMSQSHPPSHVVVTVPQPLNAPPLMMAPVYDEPSGDEQPTVSLQQQLHPVTVTVRPSDDLEGTSNLENPAEVRPSSESPYGWAESVTKDETDDPNVRNDDLPLLGEDKVADAVVEGRPEVLSLEPQISDTPTDSPTPSDEMPEICPNFDQAGNEGTDSSEPEITEYSFEIGPLVPSTNSILEDEISTVSNVQVLSYVSLDESSIVETEASASDSTRVQVGDACTGSDAADLESNDGQLDEGEEADGADELDEIDAPHAASLNAGHHSPDLLRRSPDGDSLKSSEMEASSPPNSPQKVNVAQSSERQANVVDVNEVQSSEARSNGGGVHEAQRCEDSKGAQSKLVAESAV
ncbi:hypothetical protein FHG87_008393 [Trinorchestia longiramus]|nr:hypothetical protein FHG87_008393 [Trinorchestia longiramus]